MEFRVLDRLEIMVVDVGIPAEWVKVNVQQMVFFFISLSSYVMAYRCTYSWIFFSFSFPFFFFFFFETDVVLIDLSSSIGCFAERLL